MTAEAPGIQRQPQDPYGVPGNERLFALLYAELRTLAERHVRRNAAASISATTLLHEAFLGMSGKETVFPDRDRFIGYASRVMRGLIIDMIREKRAVKRGSEFHITQLPTDIGSAAQDLEMTRLSEALDRLAVLDRRLAEVVDLKYFCGYSFEEIAAQRGTSIRTIQRDWEKARIVLFQELNTDTLD